MKSEKMIPGMNEKPVTPPSGGTDKLQKFLDSLSDEECGQFMELLKQRMGADLDGDEEAGEPAEHKAVVDPEKDEEVGLME